MLDEGVCFAAIHLHCCMHARAGSPVYEQIALALRLLSSLLNNDHFGGPKTLGSHETEA